MMSSKERDSDPKRTLCRLAVQHLACQVFHVRRRLRACRAARHAEAAGGVSVARLGCPAWSCSIRETDHTPAMAMHSAAGAEARGLRWSGAATSSLVLACPCRDLCPFKKCGSVVDETLFAMLSMFDRPFPLGQSVHICGPSQDGFRVESRRSKDARITTSC